MFFDQPVMSIGPVTVFKATIQYPDSPFLQFPPPDEDFIQLVPYDQLVFADERPLKRLSWEDVKTVDPPEPVGDDPLLWTPVFSRGEGRHTRLSMEYQMGWEFDGLLAVLFSDLVDDGLVDENAVPSLTLADEVFADYLTKIYYILHDEVFRVRVGRELSPVIYGPIKLEAYLHRLGVKHTPWTGNIPSGTESFLIRDA